MTVNSLPQIGVMSDTLICEGSNAYLWATGGVNYSWSPSSYLNQTVGREILSTPENPITYKVIVTDENNCIDSAETSIGLNVNPIADFSYNYFPSCSGFEVQFRDSSLLSDSYTWLFGDGVVSSEANPYHIFDFGTNVSTVFIVGNNEICFDSLKVDFKWKKIWNLLMCFLQILLLRMGTGAMIVLRYLFQKNL